MLAHFLSFFAKTKMGVYQSVPDPTLLPNGEPAPTLCADCKQQLIHCVCVHMKKARERSIAIMAAERQKERQAVAFEIAHEDDCSECGYAHVVCICSEAIDRVEAPLRSHMPIPVRIDKMIAFCNALSASTKAEVDDGLATLLACGNNLKTQHTVLMSALGTGVVMGSLMQVHRAQVDKWIKACDDYNAAVIASVSEPMAGLVDPN